MGVLQLHAKCALLASIAQVATAMSLGSAKSVLRPPVVSTSSVTVVSTTPVDASAKLVPSPPVTVRLDINRVVVARMNITLQLEAVMSVLREGILQR